MTDTLLKVEALNVDYAVGGGGLLGGGRKTLRAVSDISFTMNAGETLGVVGETGCGKSSLGKAILNLVTPSGGRVLWQGRDIAKMDRGEIRALRGEMQIVFQDPLSSLNPRMTVGEIVAEPLRVHAPELSAEQRNTAMVAMLERVGLRADMQNRYPNEFSGGQCQRISIARAMIVEPQLIVCDEAVSALDVSIQAQICNLLRDLQRETGVSLLFISHDLSVVRYMAQRILVMYLGNLMELSPRDELFERPRHPYSRALIGAVPEADPQRRIVDSLVALEGEIPSPLNPPSGCVFRTRCPNATPACVGAVPERESVGPAHTLACHHWRTLTD